MTFVKPSLLCLLLVDPAASFTANLPCYKTSGNPKLDSVITRYEYHYTDLLQQANSTFILMK